MNANVPIGIIVALCAVIGQVPAEPDFSGRWVIDSPPPSGEAVTSLTVQQPVSRTNVRGEPTPPAYLTITIRREWGAGMTEESRRIGVVGGSVIGVVGPQRQPRETSHIGTGWQDGSLVFTHSQSDADGNRSERRETWSLESDGRLRVEVVSEPTDQPRQTTVSLYKRTTK